MPVSMIAFEQPELFEQQLSQLSAIFVALPANHVDQQIDRELLQLLEATGMDRTSVAELSPDGRRFEVTHSHVRSGTPSLATGNLAELLPWYTEALARGEVLQFERLPEGLPRAARAEREYVTRIGLRSQLTIPLRIAEQTIG
ncbi:MAG TPA: GAF domain-containing protein, partial [Myxococcaceae bacterium]